MGSMNKVILMGNLTRKPVLRETPSGTPVADLGLAVSEHYRDKNGEKTQTTCFIDIVVWGPQAKACATYLDKGSPAVIEGKLQQDRWETETGERRSKLRVRAQNIQFMGRPSGDQQEYNEPDIEHAQA
ncbi:MAG: single-stranded DNA-binding protein [Verrucomicrobia bacterium]|nr:single-stranded DNA-binding protein [Verrucomicrobiota bacterium]